MENIILTTLSLDDIASQVAEKVYSLQQKNNEQREVAQENEFLTINQASELLNLAKPTIYTLTCKNEVPFIKKGKKLYFKKADLIEWLNAGRRMTKSEIEEEVNNHLLNKRKKINR
jgi:excisionase family DNA binding protein